jgi:DNA-binding transcriptional LysR family regulator
LLQNVALLRPFLAVAKGGSISAGAQEMSITQPAVSKAIHRLERELGVALFERRARGVVLTRFGVALLRHAKQIETEWNFAQSELGAFKSGRTGHLRVGAGLYFGAALLPAAIAELQTRFPRLRIDLSIGANPRTLPSLFSGDLDLVIGRIPTANIPDYIETRHISNVRLCVIASATHPLARKRRITAADLEEFSWVVFQDDDETVASREIMFRRMGAAPPRIAVESTSLMAIFQLLRAGPYLGCVASGLLVSAIGEGLVEIPLPIEVARFKGGAMFARTLANVAPINALIELLRRSAASP